MTDDFLSQFLAGFEDFSINLIIIVFIGLLFAVLGYILFLWYIYRKRERMSLDFVLLQVSIPKDNEVKIDGSGNKNFNAGRIEVTFTKGCSSQKTDFYLVITKDKLEEQRTTEEVSVLLEQNPELIDMFEGLRNLNAQVPVIPEFGLFAGVLTLLSAVGIFFFMRRK